MEKISKKEDNKLKKIINSQEELLELIKQNIRQQK